MSPRKFLKNKFSQIEFEGILELMYIYIYIYIYIYYNVQKSLTETSTFNYTHHYGKESKSSYLYSHRPYNIIITYKILSVVMIK